MCLFNSADPEIRAAVADVLAALHDQDAIEELETANKRLAEAMLAKYRRDPFVVTVRTHRAHRRNVRRETV